MIDEVGEGMSASDPDFEMFESIAATLKAEYVREGVIDPWADSPFAWIRARPPRQIGAIGERLVAGWCATKGLDVIRSTDSEADRVIGGRRVEIKFSMLWESGTYTFQQIRNQNYEYVVCLGISPDRVHCWIIPKDVAMSNSVPQHRGRQGTDTRWFTFVPDNPPSWLIQHGGSLAHAFQLLREIAR